MNKQIRVLVYKEGGVYYASALELNITSSGDDKFLALYNLDEAVRGYIEIIQKENLSENLLNQEVDPDLENLWNNFVQNKPVPSPYTIVSSSVFQASSFV